MLALLIAFDVTLGGIAFLITKDLMEKRSKKETKVNDIIITEGLNERDNKVLEAIKEGARNLSEVIKYTGLPKSTAYRAVQKLVKEGYITIKRENGENVYLLKEKS